MVFELQLLEALILKSKGKNAEAVRRLEPVLSAGKVEGYRRLFLDEGSAMAALLQEALHRNVEPGYVTGLLAEFSLTPPDIPVVGPALIEPLSPAELDILRLVALGWSNQKIAQERVITINTVKWHLRNIYGKLGVQNRTAAASRAKALNLL